MQKQKDLELRTLNKRHAFGVKADVYGCVNWLDDNTLTYPVGRNVVIHNIQSNSQKFFLTSEKTDSITAIALSPNKKYIAIAESGEHPQIQIVDTNTRKRRRVLNVTDLGSDRFVCMQFSADGRHLVTQGGAPQWNLLYWNWERSKPLAQVQVTRDQAMPQSRDASYSVVSQISINPRDPLHICVSGNGLFRFYRYVEGLLKQAPGGLGKAHTQHFTSHCWVTDDRIIVATDNADLLLVEDSEFRCPLPVAPSDNHAITAIVPYSKGFICGGEYGLINVFEQTDDKELYKKVRTLTIESRKNDLTEEIAKKGTIRGFSMTHGEDTLALVTATHQIYSLNFNQIDWTKPDPPPFHSITQPFHAAQVVGLDTCVRKPLVATSSQDKTVRIWNTLENTVELIKVFPTEPGAIALHPSGLHMLVCFHDRIRFMNLYGDNIQEFKTYVVRAVTDVKFSIGGQFFAVVHGNVIQIYNTYTLDTSPMGQLRGHTQKVRSIQWCSTTQYPCDNRLISCAMDGTVIDWNLREMRKEGDHTDKRYQYHSAVSDEKNIWVVGAPASSQSETKWKVKLREIEVGNMHGDVTSNDYEFPDLYLNTLVLAAQHRLLFAGCADGCVKLMTFPLQGGIHDAPILAHAGPVSKMALSHDENMLFTVGQDGSFFMFDIKEDGRSSKKEVLYADEILISKMDLEEKNSIALQLRQNYEDLRLDMDYQEKRRQIQHDERMKELNDHFKEEATKQASQIQAVWGEKAEQEKSFADIKREKAEEQRQSCDSLEKEKQRQLQQLEELCKERRNTLDWQKGEFAAQLRARDEEFERQRKEDEERFLEKLGSEEDQLRKLQKALESMTATQREARHQLEMDTDAETETIRKRYEEALNKERNNYLHMKGDNAIMKKNMTSLQKEMENKDQEVKQLNQSREKLQNQIKDLNAKIASLRDEIDQRDQTIGDKERKIYELKKRNQELEKYKFVLDHKIRQLKSQIEPKQMEIANEKEKIKAKDRELDQFHSNNLALRQTIEELKETIMAQQKEIKMLLNKVKDSETHKSRVKTDIGELASMVQDTDQLRKGINKLFDVHVRSRGGKRSASLEGELRSEFDTHCQFLSRTVESLKRKVSEDGVTHKNSVSLVMAENLQLIKEITDLRKEIRVLRNQAAVAASQQQSQSQKGETTPRDAASVSQTPRVNENAKEIEANRNEIQRLRKKIEDLEKQIAQTKAARPMSRERLPPMSAGSTQ